MKLKVLFFCAFAFSSCGDRILSENIISENQLDTLINYRPFIVDVTENEAYISISKSIFDKSQLSKNCADPLIIESEGLLFKNQSFVKSSNPIPATSGFKRNGDFYKRDYETFNTNRSLVLEKYDMGYNLISSKSFNFIEKIKGDYESIQFWNSINTSDNESFVTYSTNNYTKQINARLILGKTNGNSCSIISDFEFKNRTSCTLIGMVYDNSDNLYLLASISSKTEASYVILKLNKEKNSLELEKEFILKDVYLSKIKVNKNNNFTIFHGQDYIKNPNVYEYSPSTKNFVTLSVDFTKIEKDFNYGYPQVEYNGERFLLYFLKSEAKAMIAELSDELEIIPIFVKKEVYSSTKVVDAADGSLIMYELTNTWDRKSNEVNFYRHTSLSDIYKKTLYATHANVKECYKFD